MLVGSAIDGSTLGFVFAARSKSTAVNRGTREPGIFLSLTLLIIMGQLHHVAVSLS